MKRGPLELHPRVFRTDTRLFLPVNADPHIACLWDSNLKVHVHVRRVRARTRVRETQEKRRRTFCESPSFIWSSSQNFYSAIYLLNRLDLYCISSGERETLHTFPVKSVRGALRKENCIWELGSMEICELAMSN